MSFSFKSILLSSTKFVLHVQEFVANTSEFVEDSVSHSTDDTAVDVATGKPCCK